MSLENKMIINKEKKFIFVRQQKTATTSIISALGVHPRGILKTQKNLNNYIYSTTGKQYDCNHIPLFELKNIAPQVYKNKNDYFKFGFTRNPWERLVSAWTFAFCKKRITEYGEVSFSKFVKHHTDAWLGVEMNTLDFCDGCDFIGKLENLQSDFAIICDSLKIPNKNLPHKNRTQHKHYTEYYDDETREIVAKKYEKDIEYFGYKFGG